MTKTMTAAVLHSAKNIQLENYKVPELLPGMVLLKINRAGICGSDLHYYEHGYIGTFIPSRPFILGHELTAQVVAVNENGIKSPAIGSRVTVNPARACGYCTYCKSGRANLCRKTIMLGSGSTTPPTDGAMAQFVAVRADQCFELPDNIDDGLGAMIEPLAVGLHAIKQSGSVAGKKVLVTGGGTIGLLTALCAKSFGALPIVVSDVIAERRSSAQRFGIDATLDPTHPNFQDNIQQLVGDGFDIVFEASGAPKALRQAFDLVKPGGKIIQIGSVGSTDIPIPANMLMVKEIELIGSFRYGNVFNDAIELVASGRINLTPFITEVLPLHQVSKALEIAADRVHSLKVQVEIN
jgi:L-idonate 5-dehydrogenase